MPFRKTQWWMVCLQIYSLSICHQWCHAMTHVIRQMEIVFGGQHQIPHHHQVGTLCVAQMCLRRLALQCSIAKQRKIIIIMGKLLRRLGPTYPLWRSDSSTDPVHLWWCCGLLILHWALSFKLLLEFIQPSSMALQLWFEVLGFCLPVPEQIRQFLKKMVKLKIFKNI